MRVWCATEDEAGTVAELLIAFRDHLDHSEPPDEQFHASVGKLIGREDTEYWLASTEEGAPAAAVCQLRFRHSVWTSSEDCWLEDLYVRGEARGKGLGRALVVRAMQRAGERGCGRIELDTTEDNLAAIALYESLGFSVTSKGDTRGLLFGARLDV